MTRYIVTQEYESAEFGWIVYPDEVYEDGFAEPDLVAQLVSAGVLVPEGAESFSADLDDLDLDAFDDDEEPVG